MASRAVFAPGEAKEDWAIFRALSAVLGAPLPFDSLAQLRDRLIHDHPHLALLDEVASGSASDVAKLAGKPSKPGTKPLGTPAKDFYLTNPIARASAVMAECSQRFSGQFLQAAE